MIIWKYKLNVRQGEDLMNNQELSIYFSNYAIENNQTLNNISNQTQLKILLLLSNRVLIPPTHFLKMSDSNLDELGDLKRFFEQGYICTTLYKGFEQVTDYLSFKIENDIGYNGVYKYRLKKLDGFFESEKSFVSATDSKQGGEFTSIILNQIEEYKKNIDGRKLEKEFAEEEKYIHELIAGSNKGFLYKAEVEKEIKILKTKRKISNTLFNDTLALIDKSYFLAGAIGNNSILSYSTHYDEIGLPLNYGSHKVTNLAYSTDFFVLVLKALGIIESVSEIDSLSVNDILSLKRTPEFEKFIKEYGKLCDIVNCKNIECDMFRDSKFISDKHRNLVWWKRLAKCLVALVALPIDGITSLIEGEMKVPIYTIIAACLESFCSYSKFDKIFETCLVDKISIKLSKRIDIFSHFCLLLKEKINNCN